MSGLPKVGVLISGRGSNLQALVDAVGRGELRADLRVVISNEPEAGGLARAKAAGIETLVIPHRQFPTREAHDRELARALEQRQVTWVCLAGFMRLLGAEFCDAFPSAILNVHPSLLPSFPGVDAQRQAFEYGVRLSGVTVHFVTPELDRGPIVAQVPVEVRDDDTAETLAARILEAEHRLYPAALQSVLNGGWRVEGRRVVFSK